MALLQIAEAGMSGAPHRHRLAVGIDLGTTNSLVASVISGNAAVIRDAEQRALLPSVVRYLAPNSRRWKKFSSNNPTSSRFTITTTWKNSSPAWRICVVIIVR